APPAAGSVRPSLVSFSSAALGSARLARQTADFHRFSRRRDSATPANTEGRRRRPWYKGWVIFSTRDERHGNHTYVLKLAGDADLYSAKELERRLGEAIGSGAHRVVVDLSATSFCDSTALGLFVGARKRLAW